MKSLKYLFFLLLILIIGSSVYIATLDGHYNINQSRDMKVPADMIFNNVNDYKNWKKWGPWYEMDSSIVASYPENTIGVGGSYSWTGKDGNGYMKTTAVIPNKEIIQLIDFGSDSSPEIYWNFETIDNSTKVTWGMRGENTFKEKAYWLVNGGIKNNLEPMYQRGLELLEKQLLKEMDEHSINYVGVVDYGGGYYLYLTTSCRSEDSGKKATEMFPTIIEYMSANNIEASGKPFTLNHQIDLINNTVMFSACIPIKERIDTNGDVLTGFLAPQKTFKSNFKGNYKFLPEIWPTIYKNLEDSGHIAVQKGFSFEIYSIAPKDSSNPADWLTEIYIPIE